MAQNVIIMIGDGMGWEMARAAAVYNQIQAGNTGSSLSNFYTSGKGEGLNFQTLSNYTLATTYGTTIAGSNGVFNTGNSALTGAESATGASPLRPGFQFNPSFNPGNTATGGARVSDGAAGNLVGYEPERGGEVPWDGGYYGGASTAERFDREYIKYSYPDSANTATTLYTGVKSYNNAIGVDIYEQPLETILTTAALNGRSTGLVSSVPIDHATPGAAAAAVNRRSKYDAEFPDLDNILQQELRIYQPTVLLGGGHPLSNPANPLPEGVEPARDFTYITPDTYAELSRNPTNNRYDYTFLERGANAAQTLAQTAASLNPNAGDRLLGLYGARGQNGNLPVSSANGDYSTTGLDNFSTFSTQGLNVDTQRPLLPGETNFEFIQREVNENPTLQDLSEAALEVLGKDKDGFWLMIEGGDIDWAAHDNNIDNLIGTTLDFDKAVGSVIDWINNNGGFEENLLIVTADHDHYLTLKDNYPALLKSLSAQALTDIDDPNLAGNFWGSNPNVKYGWGNHTNRPVPVYYQGAGAEVLTSFIGQGYESYGFDVPGFSNGVDQSQIYRTMLAAVTGSTQNTLQSGTIYGSAGDDIIYADTTNDVIYGGEGTNYLYANQGNNTVYGGAGADLIYAGFGNDLIYAGEGENTIFAGSGTNTIYGGAGDDYISTGTGNDLIYAGEGENTIFAGSGTNTIYGGAGDDYISTGTGNDLIYAGEGNNVILAGAGNDLIYTGAGNDEVNAGFGDDTAYIGSGADRLVLNAGVGSVTVIGFSGDDVLVRGSGLTATSSTPAPALTFTISNGDTLVSAAGDLLATLKYVQLSTATIG